MPFEQKSVALSEDLCALTRAAGISVAAATVVSRAGAGASFCLTLADGRQLKGRSAVSSQNAVRMEDILRHLNHPAFPQVLARYQTATLAPWITGTPLDRVRLTPDLVRRCGALQGTVHTTPVPPAHPYRESSPRWTEAGLHERVDGAVQAGVLDRGVALTLHDLVARHAPANPTTGFIHHDFCGENIVLSEDGDLYVIDNDALTEGPLDYDLGRTWHRWPLPAPLRDAYLSGYDARRSSATFLMQFPYWAIAAVLAAVTFRLRRSLPAAAAVSRLTRLARVCADERLTGAAMLRQCDA